MFAGQRDFSLYTYEETTVLPNIFLPFTPFVRWLHKMFPTLDTGVKKWN